MRGRFAPSPTGRLHLGNARTALLSWLQVRRLGGQFVLRIEDIDPLRTLPDGAVEIIRDLRWLGLDWDEGPDVGGPFGPYAQSERRDRYRALLAQLQRDGRVFPCTCSRKDIQLAGAPHAGEEGPPYPGHCRSGPLRSDRTPAYRFRAGDEVTAFSDERLGPQRQHVATEYGDFVIWRNDDWPSYQLAVVADDIDMRITDILRGADLLSSTGRQLQLYGALGATPPRWHHVQLWLDEQGDRLAKRNPLQTLAGLRSEGMRPEAVVGRIARSLGWSVPPEISAGELLGQEYAFPKK